MAYSVVGHVSAGSSDTNSVTTGVLDTSGADLLVLVLGQEQTAALCTITDSKSNSWNALTTQTEGAVTCTIFWSRPTSVGSGHTFTATGVSAAPSVAVGAYRGSMASPVDQQNGGGDSAGASVSTGSITPSRSGTLVIAGASARSGSGNLNSVNGGFTLAAQTNADVNHDTVGIAYLIQGAAAAANPAFTFASGGAVKAARIASFFPKVPSMLVVF
jgi:hypothetical protein